MNDSIHNINQLPIKIYPNFIHNNDGHIFSNESLQFNRYIYLGGHTAIERSIIDEYISQIVQHDVSMTAFAASMNQEAFNNASSQLAHIDRRLLASIILAFLVLQLEISFGYSNVTAPTQLRDFDKWSWYRFPRFLACFIYLWTNHLEIIGPCGDHCSKCLVIDGHQKCRRRICAFKDVTVNTAESKNLVIGCCRTPIQSAKYCQLHISNQNKENSRSMIKGAKFARRKIFQPHKSRARKTDNYLNATGCRTLKARPLEYINKCSRTFGIIAIVTNCRIVTSFSELYRSETLKEIINLFATTIRGP